MKEFLLRLWELWKRVARVIGHYQTKVLLTIIYFLVIPFFSLIRFKDPLRKAKTAGSMWSGRRQKEDLTESFRRMF